MHEVELKFQVPAKRRREVAAAVAGRAPARRVRLQAAYVDTTDRLLAEHGIALRLRREGRVWVQTLKGPVGDGLSRVEHNVERGAAADAPSVDPALHAALPLGARLAELLAQRPDAALVVLFRTDILRRTRIVRTRLGSVELAFDEGSIVAGDARLPVCELEIELKAGSPAAVLATAQQWVARHGLCLDTRTKAERGDLLARGWSVAPARLAGAVELERHADGTTAWRAVLRSCAEQVTVNASQIATGAYDDEHVHQMRVGLRRLRSAFRLFGIAEDGATAAAAAALFRRLGAARDRAVLESEFAGSLEAAWQRAGAAPDGGGAWKRRR